MKLTKGRLKEIIKEELGRVNEDDLDLWSDDDTHYDQEHQKITQAVKMLDDLQGSIDPGYRSTIKDAMLLLNKIQNHMIKTQSEIT